MKKFVLNYTLGILPCTVMPRAALSLGAALGLGAGMQALNLGGSFLGAAFNKDAANEALQNQVKATKELMAYQQERYLSPKAQVKNLAEAGLMPSSMFGNTAPVNVGGSMAMPTAPSYGIDVGTQSLSEVAQMLVGAAQARKAGVEVPNIEADTKQKILDNERKAFENDLLSRYGLQKSAAELALAEQNVKLSLAQTDVALQEKAFKEWSTAKEKALSEVSEKQRDILQKELDNKDTELQLRNEESRQRAAASKASAAESYSAANLNKEKVVTERSQQKINDFVASIKENERNFNQASFDVRFRQELAKLDMLEINTMLEGIKANDQAAYTAFQRILFGKTQEGDFKKVVNALENIDNVTYGFKSLGKP